MLRRQLLMTPVAGLVAGCARTDGARFGGLEHAWRARAAAREGGLTVYANTGDAEIEPVVSAFHAEHPKVRVDFQRQNSAELYQRYLAERRAGKPSADLVWSSAMDLQIKLINDGYAQTFDTPARAMLPPWTIWKSQGFGVTAEPIVFVYDRRRLPDARAPRSHAALRQMLEAGQLKGSVGLFDTGRSGVGFLYYSQDRQAWADTLALTRAIGKTRPHLYESTFTLLEAVTAQQILLGYNVIGSYALERQQEDPNLGLIFPEDYTLVMSRIAFISAAARRPNAAKLFLDFLLSVKGQRLLAERNLTPVRNDVAGGVGKAPGASARPIEVGPSLLANLDQMRRRRLVADWREALGPDHVDDYRRVRDSLVTGNRP
ncbi:ABC transporter substrate-binding protein [Caulobacter sp. 1776]|uniref:ABC transporter substrate-binding protein n=1 Tax=Caulobacter sp. 1776 TaxID=3156420 RepID=UPI0033933426